MIHGFQRPMTEWSDCTLNSTPTSIVEYPLLHITVSSRQLQLGSPTSTSRTKDFLYYSTDLNNGSSDPVQLSLPCSWDLERHTYLPTERPAWVESQNKVNRMSARRLQRLSLTTSSGLRSARTSSTTINSALLRPQLHNQRSRTAIPSIVRTNSTLATFKVPTVANEPNVSLSGSRIPAVSDD